MLKYVDTMVTFSEIPDEITFCLDISNCPCKCQKCHSSYLAEDIGTPLTPEELCSLVEKNKGVSCICIMGGDAEPNEVNNLAWYIKSIYTDLKVAWYSGRQELSKDINVSNFDYIKLGPYIEEKGPLNNPNTNQILYKINHTETSDVLENITYKFWNKISES